MIASVNPEAIIRAWPRLLVGGHWSHAGATTALHQLTSPLVQSPTIPLQPSLQMRTLDKWRPHCISLSTVSITHVNLLQGGGRRQDAERD